MYVALYAFTYFVTAAGAQFTVPSPTCPGQEAVFRCTVVDNSGVSITAFRVNGDAAGQCMVSQSTVNPVTCGPDGEFTAALESISGNTYTLNLTVNATEGLNGTSVQCLNSGVDPAASPLLLIGMTTCKIQVTVVFTGCSGPAC